MSNLTVFAFDTHAVRVINENGDPWFSANDVCAALGFANPRKAVSDHVDEDDVTKRDVTDSLGRAQQTNFINESGLYALILGSRLETAKAFKKWVISEVLPSIRKTGAYAMHGAQITPAQPGFGRVSSPDMVIPEHEANLLVTADRTFRAAVRMGLAAGLTQRDARQHANEVTIKLTGINVLRLMSAPDRPKVNPASFVPAFMHDWKAGRLSVPFEWVPGEKLYDVYLGWCRMHGLPVMEFAKWFYAEADEGYPVYVELRYAPGGDMWEKRYERKTA